MSSLLIFALLCLTATAYVLGRQRSLKAAKRAGGISKLHSRPSYYGTLVALWCGLPAFLLYGIWQAGESSIITRLVTASLPEHIRSLPANELGLLMNDVKNMVAGNIVSSHMNQEMLAAAEHYRSLLSISHATIAVLVLVLAITATLLVARCIKPTMRARNQVEKVMNLLLLASSTLAVFTTIGIVLSVLFEAIRFFRTIPVSDFLFGLTWSPQMAIRTDQVGSSGAFGAVPIFTGTLMIAGIAMMVAVPLGLMSAIYLSEYARPAARTVVKPLLEILAGIPTVVYGFFAALTVAPLVRGFGSRLGLDVSSESALVAGLVMGIMIIPFISSLSDDVINAVPQSLRDGAYALGATTSETIRQVVIPAALPGIVSGVLLAVSRAIGETMIVVMAAGLSANLTANPMQAVTTVTVQIVTLLVGDQEFDSPKTLAAFALGLVLFIITLVLNIIALQVVKKYREQYE
ncbi:MAG: phosphate ABC transporter permease subunit PstC [Deltaproteobacteria bacterium]|nr:phosphate ABC transporter permease subunit PstC [Candidatus Anaeroferrophillus wilburensis]MBN2887888.1 phosphate ABC transporter permease subunit PstC [Deltaproteobacteria bacterium]